MRVLVVGSGIAGLTAALAAERAGHAVTLVSKGALAESNTAHAQGGIAAAWFADDSAAAHAADTLLAGAGLSVAQAVRVLCEGGHAAIQGLIDAGVEFDVAQDAGAAVSDGSAGSAPTLARGLEAAHSVARVLHAGGDATGAAIEAALIASVRRRGIEVHERTMLIDLVTSAGAVTGAEVRLPGGERARLTADAVLLATGGAGQLFEHTTNASVATGDGVAAAWRAGAELADLEFFQFHPTALAIPGRFLVSEAVRGEGAVLLNEAGERFMLAAHPDAELAPRDVVARAIATEMASQGGRPVLLDATDLGGELLESRFPTISAATRAAGLDWARTPIPVTPAAHYWMGGVVTDTEGRTALPGLFAIGEVARTGVHGANRLASNSLLEGAVFAARAVAALGPPAGRVLQQPANKTLKHPAGRVPTEHARPVYRDHGVSSALVSIHLLVPRKHSTSGGRKHSTSGGPWTRGQLQQLLWNSCGLERNGNELRTAAASLAGWSRPATGPGASVAALEDANLLDNARLMVAAALARGASVGAHYRSDSATSHATSTAVREVREEEAIAC